jgi:hypothetical protein
MFEIMKTVFIEDYICLTDLLSYNFQGLIPGGVIAFSLYRGVRPALGPTQHVLLFHLS